MSIRNFLSRNRANGNEVTSESTINISKNEDLIICDTAELKKMITEWTQNEGWKFRDFATFVEFTGVKTPIKLSEWDKKTYSFKCTTALNTEVTMTILFGDWIDSCSELWVTSGEETRIYVTNSNYEKGKTIPKATLQGRNITRDGKELKSYYCEYFFQRTLKLDKNHTLKVEFDEPHKYEDKSEIFVLRNCAKIEEYLLGLDNSLDITQVYEKLIEFLDFSSEEISDIDRILLTYTDKVDEEERTRSKILINNGKMLEYAIMKNGETFHVFKDGNWEYLSDDGIQMRYHVENKKYDFSVTGSGDQIKSINPSEALKRVESIISGLWHFVK